MNYQDIAQMARHGVICSDEAEYLIEFLQHTRFISNCKWVQLRNTTFRQIISGHLEQTGSPIIHAFTLSNNIARRSMEFITANDKPEIVEEDDDDDNDEFNNEANAYGPQEEHNNNHANYNYHNYDDYDDDDARRRHHYYSDDDDDNYNTDI
jgi:hypothetical protein